MDIGLLSGIADGLNRGTKNYFDAQADQQKLLQQKQAQQLTMQQAGYTTDEKGNIIPGDVKAAQIASDQSLMDPDSPETQREILQQKKSVLFANPDKAPEDVDSLFPDGTTGVQAREYGKQFITGGYGVQGAQVKSQGLLDAAAARAQAAQTAADAKAKASQEAADKKTASQNTNKALQLYAKDPVISQYTQRMNGADRILQLLDDADNGKLKNNQSLLNLVNGEIARLDQGTSAVGEQTKEGLALSSQHGIYQQMLDKLGNKVTNVPTPDITQQMRALGQSMKGSYQSSANDRIEALKAGALPEQQAVFTAKQGLLNKPTSAPTGGSGAAGGGLLQGAGGKVKVSNGNKTFMIDPADVQNAQKDGFNVVQ